MTINFNQVYYTSPTTELTIEHWSIKPQESWGVLCADQTTSALIGDLLCQEVSVTHGQLELNRNTIEPVSLKQQQQLLELEIANDDTDFLDRLDHGSSVRDLVMACCVDAAQCEHLLEELDLTHLVDHGFRMLSTGETRRVMLARAIAREPNYLYLDDPFAGLDAQHRVDLQHYLTRLSDSIAIIISVNRLEDMPQWVDQIAVFADHQLVQTVAAQNWQQHPVVRQLTSLGEQQSQQITALLDKYQYQPQQQAQPVFAIIDGKVEYTDQIIFNQLNWTIEAGQHWQVAGPNGCGKSTLLGLIFGDHPQCYSNQIELFGYQRGSGESIWQIKQHIGLVSSALHLQYRASCTALEAVISGFYDSIGLYTQPTKQQRQAAQEWLAILHLSDCQNQPFRQLEYAQQRLILLARALIKQPKLLILDEPYQGLDYLGRLLFNQTIRYIVEHQLSQVLYVSHYEQDNIPGINHRLTFVYNHEQGCYQAQLEYAKPCQ
ncbi:ATP-binding cassette domain-containing protein [Vibrio sp. WXL103]|uniref:ATP-binding cassette domain-containing protein n=1 Tax=Vibrio sp. WXL103 TaxID=3450710 RepID=UPI003EC4ED20